MRKDNLDEPLTIEEFVSEYMSPITKIQMDCLKKIWGMWDMKDMKEHKPERNPLEIQKLMGINK